MPIFWHGFLLSLDTNYLCVSLCKILIKWDSNLREGVPLFPLALKTLDNRNHAKENYTDILSDTPKEKDLSLYCEPPHSFVENICELRRSRSVSAWATPAYLLSRRLLRLYMHMALCIWRGPRQCVGGAGLSPNINSKEKAWQRKALLARYSAKTGVRMFENLWVSGLPRCTYLIFEHIFFCSFEDVILTSSLPRLSLLLERILAGLSQDSYKSIKITNYLFFLWIQVPTPLGRKRDCVCWLPKQCSGVGSHHRC